MVEPLEQRLLLSVTATFSPPAGTLSIFGDSNNNTIVVSRDLAGGILVNGGAVVVRGGTPSIANTTRVQIFGLSGNDTLALDESNGALPSASIYGGAGDDTITGGSNADLLFGQAGDDTILGKGGLDLLFGGGGSDTLIGGDGNDQVFGQGGQDLMVWNPGDDTDLNEGGEGIDTVQVNGGGGDETFAITANGTRVRFDRLDPAPFTIDIGTTEQLVVNANGGNDLISATGNLAALIQITMDGGPGNDTLLGSNGADILIGGDDDDFIDGQQGNDLALLGAGNDTFQWDPGDGSDTVEGQAGFDTLLFNGSNASETMAAMANGSRVLFTRDIGGIVMDLDGVERVDVNALGGGDTLTVGDLSGTDATEFNVNLAGTLGGSTGDGQTDAVVVRGTDASDVVNVVSTVGGYSVLGLSTTVNVVAVDPSDTLTVLGLGGNDTLNASGLPASAGRLTLDGGADDDTLLGGAGSDTLIGGEGNDLVDGGQGSDVALLGAGNDVFRWNPGDGSDIVEGQADADMLLFTGSAASEEITISANGPRTQLFRNVGNVTLDLNGIERMDVQLLGGADRLVLGDLSLTDVTEVNVDLSNTVGGDTGDGQVDQIVVTATNDADVVSVTGSDTSALVVGLATAVSIKNTDAEDELRIDALGGDDTVDASALTTDVLRLTLNGGLGNDLLIGSDGDDIVIGGDGNDVALLGGGNDTFVWNPGDDNDTVEGQDGFDTLQFNGANVSELFDISANGGRIRFLRNVANITMDLDGVESINLRALGGADTVTVGDLSGTDLAELNVDLTGATGQGDGQSDNIIVSATDDNDVVVVSGDANGTTVLGLSAQVNITGAEANTDRLTVNASAGDDVVDASSLAASAIQLTANGGDDDDVLIGGDGNDILLGGEGDDVLIGGPGIDVLDGGPGANIVIQ